ncbi:MAG: ParM/StbA family protein, partial [Chloroflexaceae bacterium]|nr:ParM/StbA family protein [Chloroflexaceae bacterium]
MEAHGINLGHGFVKAIILDRYGRETPPLIFPAVVAPAPALVVGALATLPRVVIDRQPYLVGDAAQGATNPRTDLSQQRMANPVILPALMQHIVHQRPINGERAICVTGLPATWAQDRGKAQLLGERIRSQATHYTTIQVIPEPLGVVYAQLLDRDGHVIADHPWAYGRIGVIDLGHHTVDIAVVDRLHPLADQLQTYSLGTARVLTFIQQCCAAQFDCDLSRHATDHIVRAGQITHAGQNHPLPDTCLQHLAELGTSLTARLIDRWGSGQQLDAILLGGGGAALAPLTDAIQQRFPHAQVVPDPQLAVAR